jgi:hypothetical protein
MIFNWQNVLHLARTSWGRNQITYRILDASPSVTDEISRIALEQIAADHGTGRSSYALRHDYRAMIE